MQTYWKMTWKKVNFSSSKVYVKHNEKANKTLGGNCCKSLQEKPCIHKHVKDSYNSLVKIWMIE